MKPNPEGSLRSGAGVDKCCDELVNKRLVVDCNGRSNLREFVDQLVSLPRLAIV